MWSKHLGTKLLIYLGLAGVMVCQAEVVINRPIIEKPKTLSEQIGEDAGFTLSSAYDNYQHKDYETAYNEFDFFVKKNDIKALVANGYLLFSGYVPTDFVKASDYLAKAASFKYARAVYLQALLEKRKQNSTQFNITAERLINRAAAMGDYVAANTLANYHFQKANYALAQRWNEKAIMLGSPAAKRNQSMIFNRAEHTVSNPTMNRTVSQTPNHELISELRERSKNGEANASYELAIRYHKGAGIAVNFGEAIRLYQLAAKQGSSEAKKILPILLSKQTTGGNLNSMWMQEMSNMLPNPVIVNTNNSGLGSMSNEPRVPNHEYLDIEKGASAIHVLEEDDPLDGLLRLSPHH
ncbi:hypothetical protein BKK56_02360 [Rodentibacter genomosp. 2]|uniref:tetratricopeptide repeat protein n=1 Tax=Rodentibacter genomosp. 2 TaxID=1908266 RepID=UPI0009855698|nr:hypothetical protein BKK56_02360 [Rodentibacter genomosp. 2]